MHLRARATGARRAADSPSPASTRRQPSASTISGAEMSPRSVCTVWPGAAVHLGGLELAVGLLEQQAAQLAVVEGGEGPRQRPAAGAVRRAHHQLVEGLAVRPHQVQRLEPRRGDAAGGGLALADLVAVDHQHARGGAVLARGAGQLARHREAGEAGPADEHVVVARERGAVLSALGRSLRHRHRRVPRRRRFAATLCGRFDRHRNAHPTQARRGLRRSPPRDRRPDRPQLRRHPRPLRGGRRRLGQGRAHRPGRGAGRHRLQERGGHPLQRAVDPEVGRPRRRGGAGRGGRRARPHQGGPGRPPAAVQEARPLREGVAAHRGRGRVRRARGRQRDRGRQGRPDHRPGRARLPAGVARGHPPRAEPRRVHGPDDPVQGDRAQPLAQQRGAVAPRRPGGGAQGGPPADPGPPAARPGGGGRDLQHRRLRRVRGPRRHRRPDPHLRAFVEPREPPVRDPLDRRQGAGQGARHRPRPPAHLPGPQADPGGPVAARGRHLQPGRRARGRGHQGRDLRRVRRDHGRRRGPRAHLRAGPPPRGEPARGGRARPDREGEDPRDRLRPAPAVAQRQARGRQRAAARHRDRRLGGGGR